MKKIKACIIGAAGYTGSELLKLLISHPSVEVVSAVSRSQAGKAVTEVFPELTGETDLVFSAEAAEEADVYFICLQHGDASKFLDENPHLLQSKVIDLSRDFRLRSSAAVKGEKFVYGLP